MTDAVQIAIITTLGGIAVGSIPGTFAAFAAFRARHAAERAEALSRETKGVTVETAHRIDGRMDELLELARTSSFAAGVLQQKDHGEAVAKAIKESHTATVIVSPPTLYASPQPSMRPEVERQERDAEKGTDKNEP